MKPQSAKLVLDTCNENSKDNKTKLFDRRVLSHSVSEMDILDIRIK